MVNFVLRLVTTLAGLKCADLILPNFKLTGGMAVLLVGSLLLGILNWLVKPALIFFSVPLLVPSSSIFYLIINALVIYTASLIFPNQISGSMLGILLASMMVSVLQWILTACLRVKKHE